MSSKTICTPGIFGNKVGYLVDGSYIQDTGGKDVGKISSPSFFSNEGSIESHRCGRIGYQKNGYWYDTNGEVVAKVTSFSVELMKGRAADRFIKKLF